MFVGRCPERWQQCLWGRGAHPVGRSNGRPERSPGADTAGASGAGDPLPFAGNGGYDVQHYDLDLAYTPPAPPRRRLSAS